MGKQVVENVQKKPIADLIDRALVLRGEIAERAKELDEIKAELREEAKRLDRDPKRYQKFTIDGNVGLAEVSDAEPWVLEPKALRDYLKERGKLSLMYALVKVSVTETQRYLGEVELKKIGKKVLTKYRNVTLKRK